MDFLASLHPKVVHFPVAFLILYPAIELAGILFKKEKFNFAALIFLTIGLIGCVAAVLTGNQARENWELWSSEALEAFEAHEFYSNAAVWFFTSLFFFRIYLPIKKKFIGNLRYVVVAMGLIGAILIYKSASYGGEMVFKHGVGVEKLKEKKD